jgi:hypothetical protein
MTQPLLYALLREIPDSADLRKLYGEGDQRLEALARVLACDSRWEGIPGVTLLVRLHPSPMLGVMGYFDAAQQARIESLPGLVSKTLQHLRYVDYRQAERDCEQLAAKLVAEIGTDALRDFRFTGIPRGGLIVLGMLAYALGLSRAQLTPQQDAPLVVVDDCAISGLRFREYLESCQNERVIFAPLYANPALRQAITAQEPRVQACISAHDVQDYAPAHHQDEYEVWRARWEARKGDSVYWTGMPEHVCFAWNEPDNVIWNAIAEQEELGWRIVPGEFCLKNRVNQPQPVAAVQRQPAAQGSLKPGADVLFGELDEQVIVANVETGANLCLEGVGADMWRAVINSPDLDTAVQDLLRVYEVDERTLRADLEDFVYAMRQQGILVE